MSPAKEKILLLLFAGLSLGFSYLPRQQIRILKGVSREWKWIDEKALREKVRELYRSKLVEKKENPDGSQTLILSEKGKLKALTYRFKEMKIKKENWDGKWRVVIFDIPERLRCGRDILRDKLKVLGFYELQKSVLVFPYECKNEIEFIVEFFGLKPYVRLGILEAIDNELHLKKNFNLI